MGTWRRSLTARGNRIGAWTYRRFDGRLSSGPGATVLLFTAAGRRTGLPRSTPIRYLDVDDGFLVWGTASGATRDPDWFRNLRAAEECRVQVRDRILTVRPRELLGDERDEVWRKVVLARVPGVAKYERKAARTIPVAVLTPVTEN